MQMKLGDKVRVYLMTMGNRFDIHSIYFGATTQIVMKTRVDHFPLVSGMMYALDVIPTQIGNIISSIHQFINQSINKLYFVEHINFNSQK
jgi:hypothetical protein